VQFFLFTSDPVYARAATESGMDALVVDWECPRPNMIDVNQDGTGKSVNENLLTEIRNASNGYLVCRVNNNKKTLACEIEKALSSDVDEIWLPMVTSVDEIESSLDILDGRAKLGVMAETVEIICLARELEKLNLSRVFFGLNDYMIEAKKPNIFSALIDGDIDRFRDAYTGPFAVAGITDPAKGSPVAQKLLLSEMLRLDCTFAVGRRAFRNDVPADKIENILRDLRQTLNELVSGGHEDLTSLRRQFVTVVKQLPAMPEV